MCTIIILRDVHPEFPVVIAANRDEIYARAATGPTRVPGGRVAGLDERGGTWLGLGDAGLIAAVTNRGGPPVPGRKSRGLLPLYALSLGRDPFARELVRLEPDLYSPFNLLFGDADELFVAEGLERMA